MILAAGIGSRLRPLTDRVPKALVEVGGATMLQIVARRLKAAGVTELIVNAHHHAPLVAEAAVRLRAELGLRVEVSREDEQLLDTGGGLKKAAAFFDDGKTFIVHNVDILCDLSLADLLRAHKPGTLATLAMMDRSTSRKLLFSASNRLLGRATQGVVPPPGAVALGFSGIQAVSPEIFPLLNESGPFSLTDAYVRLAAEGRNISSVITAGYWADIGDMTKLEAARERASKQGLPA
jgi:NDP-sugar pyrophosphorylase family protein